MLFPKHKNSLFGNGRIMHQKSIPLDLSQAVNTDIPLLLQEDASTRVFPFHLVIDKFRVNAAFGTDPSVQVRVGDSSGGTSSVVVAATAITDVEGDCQILVPPQTSFPTCKDGSELFLRISTAAVGPLTASRARTNNIATIVMGANHNLIPGDTVRLAALGAGYDGSKTVLDVPTSGSFTFASKGANEATTADTNGTVALFAAFGHLVMLYF